MSAALGTGGSKGEAWLREVAAEKLAKDDSSSGALNGRLLKKVILNQAPFEPGAPLEKGPCKKVPSKKSGLQEDLAAKTSSLLQQESG